MKTAPWIPQRSPSSLAGVSTGSLAFSVKRGKPDPKRLDSLTAAAQTVTTGPGAASRVNPRTIGSQVVSASARAWQEEVLAAVTQVGELRYITRTIANACSRAWIYPADAKTTQDATQRSSSSNASGDNAPEEDGAPPGAVDPELVKRIAAFLVLTGECYLVDIKAGRGRPSPTNRAESHVLAPMDLKITDDEVQLWVNEQGRGGARYKIGDGAGQARITRIYNPDLRNGDQPDSAARAALPVLRLIIGLEMHASATVDSKLGAATVLAYPSDAEISRPVNEPQAPSFADAFTEAAIAPINDRDTAAALCPILIGVPPDMNGSIKGRLDWLANPGSVLDAQLHTLSDDYIRRLALSMDAPPEVLLGTSGANHFSAWSIDSELVRLQVAPLLKIIADALSFAYDIDYTYDTGPLTVRPNRAVEAQALYDRGAISGAALRAACGFSEDDAPDEADKEQYAYLKAMALCEKAPSLISTPGFPAVWDQMRIGLGLAPKNQKYYPGKEDAPLAGGPTADTNGRENSGPTGGGQKPSGNRPVSDGSPSSDSDGKPVATPS